MTRPPDLPVAPDDFATLVACLRAEMAAGGRLVREAILRGTVTPASFAGRPWVSAAVLLTEAAYLSGYSVSVFRHSAGPYSAAWFPVPVTPPAHTRYRRWAAGDIAAWVAARDPARDTAAAEVVRASREPAGQALRVPVQKDQRRRWVLLAVAEIIAADPSVLMEDAARAARDAGVRYPQGRYKCRWIDQARAMALPAIVARLAPGPDGVTTGEVAEVFGMPRIRVRRAVQRGEILAVRAGDGGPSWYRIDPGRLRYRRENPRYRRSLPPLIVDRDHPQAVPLPGD